MIIHGDCLEILPTIKKKSIDLVLVDLPYGTTKCKWDQVIDLNEMWKKLLPLCKDNTAIVMFAQTPFDKVLRCSNLPMLKYEWIWEKGNATGHLNAKKMPLKAHENILVFYKKLPTYNPQKTHGHIRKTAKIKTINSNHYGKVLKFTPYDSTSRYPRSIQQFKSTKQKEKFHDCQKPVALCEYLIKTYSDEGDLVLDFTAGGGSVGEACLKTGREFILIEKNLESFNTCCDRLIKNKE